jgi:hypothetical protein
VSWFRSATKEDSMKLSYRKRRNEHGLHLGIITPWDESVMAELEQRGTSGKLGWCDHLTPNETDPDQAVPAVWFPSLPELMYCADCAEAVAFALYRRNVHRCDICHRDTRKAKLITDYWLRCGPVTTIRYRVCLDCT